MTKAVLFSAQWAGQTRRLALEQAPKASGDRAELEAKSIVLRDRVEFLTRRLACAQRRFGAVGKRGSIAVTEPVIHTPKHEWPWRVPVTRVLDHLGQLLSDFTCCYNSLRPHTTLGGAVPDVVHASQHWQRLPRTAKAVPSRIEHRFLPETRVAGFRLAA